MNKREIIAYFDARAPEWDARMVRSDSKIAFILDAAGVRPGVSVLDVACGTGVLFGDYLARDAARVTGVDISPEMARIAVSKLRDPRVEVLCGDVEELAPQLIAKHRRIYKGVSPNVDFYSGFVYDMLGIPQELYTAMFAVARIVGWSAHRIEELICMDKIIRPAYMSVMEERE